MSKGSFIRRVELVDNQINGEVNTAPFLEEALVEEKEQPMICQHLFQQSFESALGFQG